MNCDTIIRRLFTPMGEESTEREELREGDIICYRMGIVKVLSVDADGAYVRGPYGEEQTIDWEDIEQYNRGMYKQPICVKNDAR